MGVRISVFAPQLCSTSVSGLDEYADGCLFEKGADWYPFCLGGGTGRGVWGVGGGSGGSSPKIGRAFLQEIFSCLLVRSSISCLFACTFIKICTGFTLTFAQTFLFKLCICALSILGIISGISNSNLACKSHTPHTFSLFLQWRRNSPYLRGSLSPNYAGVSSLPPA